MTDARAEAWVRMAAAVDGCDRVLSHGKRPSMRARLATLAKAAEHDYDLAQPPDVYGDGVTAELEHRVAGLLGKPAAAFFPTGNLAQQAAIRSWRALGCTGGLAIHPLAHPLTRGQDAFSTIEDLPLVRFSAEPRFPTAQEVLDLPEPFGVLMLELPMRDAGFLLPSWEQLCAIVAAARSRSVRVHFDGARLWESTTFLGRPLEAIAELADSVYVSFYKALGGLAGAALAGPEDLIADARILRHRYGGLPHQQFPTILSALTGLRTELPRLPTYVAHARRVADALSQALTATSPWFRIHPSPPHTHQFQLWLPFETATLEAAGLAQALETKTALFGRWREVGQPPGVSVTEVMVAASALEWRAADVIEAVRAFMARVTAQGARRAITDGYEPMTQA